MEHKLKLIELRKFTRRGVHAHISQLVTNVVRSSRPADIPRYAFATVPAPCRSVAAWCRKYRSSSARKCDFSLWKVVSGREWSPDEVARAIHQALPSALTRLSQQAGQAVRAGLGSLTICASKFDFGQRSGCREGEEAPGL